MNLSRSTDRVPGPILQVLVLPLDIPASPLYKAFPFGKRGPAFGTRFFESMRNKRPHRLVA